MTDSLYRPAPLALLVPPFAAAQLTLATLIFLTFIAGLISSTLFLIGFFLIIAAIGIYADPPRQIPQGHGLILSPIDGHLKSITKNVGLPLTFDQAKDQQEHFMQITMTGRVRGCRTLRAPAPGTIREILRYTPDDVNENHRPDWTQMDGVAILIETSPDCEYALVLHGYIIPRQIHLNVKVGDVIKAGDRLGTILFYAQCELYLRQTAPLIRTIGHHVQAGETVLQAAGFQGTPLFNTI